MRSNLSITSSAIALTDWFSWRPTLAAIGGLGLVASAIFWVSLPASAQFQPKKIPVATLIETYRGHLRTPAIIALVLEAGLVLGSLVREPDHFSGEY